MTNSSRKTEWLVWGALILVIAGIGAAFVWSKMNRAIPLPVLGRLTDFSLTNQDGAQITLSNLQGNVCIADVVFTRCPGPCPRMTHHMAELQAAMPSQQPVKFVTLTSDPEFDTPPVLKKYATQFGVDSSRWYLLTGLKREIQRLSVDDFKFVMVEKPAKDREMPEDLFIHSTWFVLIDQQGQVRGWQDEAGQLHAYFDSEDPVAREKILSAARQLLRQPRL